LHVLQGILGILVDLVDYTVENVAILNAFNFHLNVSLPSEESRDGVSILELNDLYDSQDPFTELLLRYLQLLADINLDQLERLIGRDLNFERHLDLSLLEIGYDFFCGLIKDERGLVQTQRRLRNFNFLDIVLEYGRGHNLLNVGHNQIKDLLFTLSPMC
jgi:hypothetical protein